MKHLFDIVKSPLKTSDKQNNMKKNVLIFLSVIVISLLFSCNEYPPNWSDGNTSGIKIDGPSSVEKLNNALLAEMSPLSNDPNEWTDDQLFLLDGLSNSEIVGLGEATCGTSEFFSAKHRIFKYLVENHEYKVLVMEADFGESLLINEAIWEGRAEDIKQLMTEHMHKWSLKTEEIRLMLEWMSNYNKGKSESERVIYMGSDCQFNNSDSHLLKRFLQKTDQDLYDQAYGIIGTISQYPSIYENISTEEYKSLIVDVDNFIGDFTENKNKLVQASSEKEYELNVHIIEVMKQVIQYHFHATSPTIPDYLRDEFMAENVSWIYNYYDQKKIVLWSHNGHIADDPMYSGSGGSMGNYLKLKYRTKYAKLGFSFYKGTFLAENYQGSIVPFEIKAAVPASINEVFARTTKTFLVNIEQLNAITEWNEFFKDHNTLLSIQEQYSPYWLTTAYNKPFFSYYFDFMIHFNNTKASRQQ